MSKKELLLNEIEQLPDPILEQVLDFVHFLRLKMTGDSLETAFLSESSLAKDWLTEDEDQVWQDL